MFNWPLLTKEAECRMPLNVTVEEAMNPLPLIVSTSGLEPAVPDDGDRLATEGCGLNESGPTEIVTPFWLALPPIESEMASAWPVRMPVGICTFTCISPETKPLASA
jgi:hypothetical protein